MGVSRDFDGCDKPRAVGWEDWRATLADAWTSLHDPLDHLDLAVDLDHGPALDPAVLVAADPAARPLMSAFSIEPRHFLVVEGIQGSRLDALIRVKRLFRIDEENVAARETTSPTIDRPCRLNPSDPPSRRAAEPLFAAVRACGEGGKGGRATGPSPRLPRARKAH